MQRQRQPVQTCKTTCMLCSEPKLNVSMDQELIELWRKTALPADPAELDAELRRAGLVRFKLPLHGLTQNKFMRPSAVTPWRPHMRVAEGRAAHRKRPIDGQPLLRS